MGLEFWNFPGGFFFLIFECENVILISFAPIPVQTSRSPNRETRDYHCICCCFCYATATASSSSSSNFFFVYYYGCCYTDSAL